MRLFKRLLFVLFIFLILTVEVFSPIILLIVFFSIAIMTIVWITAWLAWDVSGDIFKDK